MSGFGRRWKLIGGQLTSNTKRNFALILRSLGLWRAGFGKELSNGRNGRLRTKST